MNRKNKSKLSQLDALCKAALRDKTRQSLTIWRGDTTAAGEAFAHYIRTDGSGARPLPPQLLGEWLAIGWLREPEPCRCPIEPADLVIDPFVGSGTVGEVCERLGRRWVGTDLNYQHLSKKRTQQRGLRFSEVGINGLEGKTEANA